MAKRYRYLGCFFLLAALPLVAQAPALSDMYAQIRAEETNNSKIMWIIREVADVYGPRVTGTPNLKAADDWAVRMLLRPDNMPTSPKNWPAWYRRRVRMPSTPSRTATCMTVGAQPRVSCGSSSATSA